MKIRQGFVSNSSSSSFMVAAKLGSYPKVQVNLSADLDSFAEEYIETKEELETFFKNYYYYDREDYDELHNKWLELIESGHKLLYCTVSSDSYDDLVSVYLYNNGISNDDLTDGIVIDED